MNTTSKITAAALAALAMGACATGGGSPMSASSSAKPTTAPAADAGKKGECWGVNACKGQGACGGVGHECAGQNACKGQGWLSLSKPDCDAKGGKFKAG